METEKYPVSPPEQKGGLFDMKDELMWLEENKDSLIKRISPQILKARNKKLPENIKIHGPQYLPLPLEQLTTIFNLFPENKIFRHSTLAEIIPRPPAYFSKNSTAGQPVLTHNAEEALSPTSISPAMTEYFEAGDFPKSRMYIYAVPQNLTVNGKPISQEALALMYTHKLVHEYTHTFINDLFIRRTTRLKLPDGTFLDGRELMMKFEQFVEQKGPISTYDGAYRDGNTFRSDPSKPAVRLNAISESLAEAITAKITGFTFSKEENRRLNPFADRPEIEHFVHMFLSTELAE